MKVIFCILQYFIVFCVSFLEILSTTDVDVTTNTIGTTETVPDLIENICASLHPPRELKTTASISDIIILWNITQDIGCTQDAITISCSASRKNETVRKSYQLPSWLQDVTTNLTDLKQGIEYKCFGKLRSQSLESNNSKEVIAKLKYDYPRNLTILNVTLDNETNNYNLTLTFQYICQPIRCNFNVSILGHYSLDTSLMDSRNYSVSLENKINYSLQIANLWPSSEYSFNVTALYDNDTGNVSSISYRTNDALAGPPTVKVNKIDHHLKIIWVPSELKSGKILNYILSIEGRRLYDQPSRCPSLPKLELQFDNEINSYSFPLSNESYYTNYNISVLVNNSAGYGKKGYANISTPEGVPEKPVNLTATVNEQSVYISWLVPCLSNGEIDYFDISRSAFYSEEPRNEYIYNDTLVNYENSKYIYSIPLERFNYSFHYTVGVKIVLKRNISGTEATYSFTTPDGFPAAPIITNTAILNTSFVIYWKPPEQKMGHIQKYAIDVTSLGPAYATLNTCKPKFDINVTYPSELVNGTKRSFQFKKAYPFFNYSVAVTAYTTKGSGDSAFVDLITHSSVPENVYDIKVNDLWVAEHEDYMAHANITFEKPCFLNGPLWEFQISSFGNRSHYPDITLHDKATSPYILHLKPEYMYQFSITTITHSYKNTSGIVTFQSPAGVPKFSITPETIPVTFGTSSAEVTLKKEYFDESNGEIKYISLIVTDQNVTGDEIEYWNETHWPAVQNSETNIYYQITDDWWYPFEESNEITFEIGSDKTCKNLNCNKPLEENKDYYLIIRIFTSRFYRNSRTIFFKTDQFRHLGMILGIIFGILIASGLALAAFFVWKRNIFVFSKTIYSRKSSVKSLTQSHTSIQVGKFLDYYKLLENNPEQFKEQFMLMDEKTKEILKEQTFAYSVLTENKRKNRYVNILPYDDTRVKLLIDEDDEIGSDYINASYIKGYTGQVEYIATQGPLPSTCRDFWKMVLQENITIIVMVSQFIENNREKCFKYFPKNQGTMIIGEDMEVKCSTEIDFGAYCLRSIQVKRDNTQVTVTHMQYLEWPDFGVPQGTDHMLQFCNQIRQRIKMNNGYMIVHCSAGVGRTGTIIATDILLQCVNSGKNIDTFNTILELRKQRSHMVQTEKQYIYIHSLIKDFIERPPTPDLIENIDPVYENICIIKDHSSDTDLKVKTEESAF